MHTNVAQHKLMLAHGTYMQILLAVLAREYDWELDREEPLKTFPLPVPAWGAPMTFCRLNQPAS